MQEVGIDDKVRDSVGLEHEGRGRESRQGENKVPLARRSEPIFIKVSDSIKRLG